MRLYQSMNNTTVIRWIYHRDGLIRRARILFTIFVLICLTFVFVHGGRINLRFKVLTSNSITSIKSFSPSAANDFLKKWTMDQSLEAIKRLGEEIYRHEKMYNRSVYPCPIHMVGLKDGDTYGAHALCDYRSVIRQKGSCLFYSFGIASNYHFDTELASEWGCQGVAFDPNAVHMSKLHPKITFHTIAGRMLSDAGSRHWLLTSTVPKLQKCFGHTRIDILKMDCEGCEYSLARDIEEENLQFFENVNQFAVEVHVSKRWMETSEYVLYYGKLLYFLEQANLRLMYASIGSCAPYDEALGCPQELLDVNYPCGSGKMCHNLLFAKWPPNN